MWLPSAETFAVRHAMQMRDRFQLVSKAKGFSSFSCSEIVERDLLSAAVLQVPAQLTSNFVLSGHRGPIVSLGIPPVNDSQPGEDKERTSMRTKDRPGIICFCCRTIGHSASEMLL